MYFKNVDCIEELKKQYHKLCFKYHPDMGGDKETMQAINAEYDILFKKYKNIHRGQDGGTYEQETEETPQEFKKVIDAIIHLDGIQIEICGSWVWVTGNTYEHRETLKSVGFKFSKKKLAWYWHTEGYRKHSKKTFTLDEIRAMHGSDILKSQPRMQLEAG